MPRNLSEGEILGLFGRYLQEWLPKEGGQARFRWDADKEREFDAVPYETLLDDPYFFGHFGRELYPAHRGDILELFRRKEEGEDIRVFVDEEGFSSGKTWKATVIFGILVYKTIILMDKSKLSPKLAADSRVGFVCTGRTQSEATDWTFMHVLRLLLKSPFFMDYFPPNVTLEDVERFRRNPRVLRFPGGVFFGTTSGALGEFSQLGVNLVGGMADEVNFYDYVKRSSRIRTTLAEPEAGFDAAQEVFDTFYDRISSRMEVNGRWPLQSLILFFCSAAFPNDMTDRLIKRSRIDPTIFARRRATWEAQPWEWKGERLWSGEFFEYDVDRMEVVNPEEARQRYLDQFGHLAPAFEEAGRVEEENISGETDGP